MTPADRSPGLRIGLGLAFALLLAGCGLLEAFAPPAAPWAEVRGERSAMPPAAPIHRVLVLPFAAHDAVPGHAEALRLAFAQVLRSSCGFDVVSPDVATLPRTTRDELFAGNGREIAALVRLHREWGADAVLYGRLAFSRPYGDPGVGLDLELVDARDGARLWSAKDVVDASEAVVRESLLRFRGDESGREGDDPSQVPFEVFTRFVARSFVRTLFAPAPGAGVEAAAESLAVTQQDPGNGFPSLDDR